MKLINKEGKIFGKVNIIDVLIILFIVAVVVLGVLKYTKEKGPVFANQNTDIELDILFREMYGDFEDELNVGEPLFDNTSGQYLGEIVDKQLKPAVKEVERADGSIVVSEVPGRWDIYITVACKGIYNERRGLTIGGDQRYAGLFFRLNTPTFTSSGVIIRAEAMSK